MITKNKKMIIGVLVVILAFVVYTAFLRSDPEADSFLENSDSREFNQTGEEIIRTLSRIQKIELNQSVFGDPIYLRLRDDSEPISVPNVGRDNPFEPLNAGVTIEAQAVDNN